MDASVFNEKPKSIEILDNTSGALKIANGNGEVHLLGSVLSHNTEHNNLKAKYALTYENGAILPDGTTKDVVVTLELHRARRQAGIV